MKYNKHITPEEYVKRRVGPIFKKALQEAKKNPMSVGLVGSEEIPIAFYCPHNYRAYCDFKKENFKPNTFIKTDQKRSVVTPYKIKNSTEMEFRTIEDFIITVKKYQIEIRNMFESKRRYPVELSQKGYEKTMDIVRKKDKECLDALRTFIKIYGGKSDFKILNRSSEDKIENEDVIDTLDIKMKFDNKIVKKGYNEGNIEYKGPAFAAHYFVNRGIENVSPLIAQELRLLGGMIQARNPLKFITSHLSSLQDIFTHEKLIKQLTLKDKEELELFVFEKFGVTG